MKFTSAVLALAAMASAVPSPLAIEEQLAALEARTAEETSSLEARQQVAPTNCTTKGVHFILVRGHGGPVTINGKSVPDPNPYNVLRSLGTMITNQIPGSDQLALPYDYNNSDEIGGTVSGTQLLTSYIKNYVASCPNSKIAMLGYSQGALVVMDTLCGASYFPMFPTLPLDSKYAKNSMSFPLVYTCCETNSADLFSLQSSPPSLTVTSPALPTSPGTTEPAPSPLASAASCVGTTQAATPSRPASAATATRRTTSAAPAATTLALHTHRTSRSTTRTSSTSPSSASLPLVVKYKRALA